MTEATMDMNERHCLYPSRVLLVFSGLGLFALLMLLLNIGIGSVSFSPARIIDIVLHPDSGTASAIIWDIRIPRALGAVMGGAFLAISGLLLQVYFRNPIVGPYILGISSGATVMVSLVMLTTLTVGFTVLNPYMCTLASILGAYAVMSLILVIASRVKSGITLLIVGLMMGYLCGAVTAVLTALAEKEKIKGFILWELGSFSGFKWSEISMLALMGGALLVLVFALSKPLNAFLLGEEYAASMGVNIRRFRVLILMSACALAGMVTALAGPIAFVGMAVPHMARLFFGTSDNRILIPGASLVGAAVASLCDLIARMVMSPVELPLSSITAFFGAPIVLTLLIRRKVEL
ncbi:FecCD family ABC transporter permease [Pelobacter propionicus]|uniref:Transport system permease protein n=1 Tax=Pelobacter propionicus (strain DSM 2379 / NBRC 103807 / OttBd1) TaxID=338966 RepID=A1ANF8_PELPD|nr:iron ABC transporter permease [Pelobacter propionicus]ABK98878.1 transport system permease protein [Pelobacter propionicus DSM 2379]